MRKFKLGKVLSSTVVAAMVAASFVGVGFAEGGGDGEDPEGTGKVERLPNHYIVTFEESKGVTISETKASFQDKISKLGGKVSYKGQSVDFMTIEIPDSSANEVEEIQGVKEVIENQRIDIQEEEMINNAKVSGFVDNSPHYELWDYDNIKGQGTKVAVIDSGVDADHEDLDIDGGYNFTTSNDDSWDTDTLGHGTHVIGNINAQHNGIGVKGIAPEAEMWSYKTDTGDGGGYIEVGAVISSLDHIAKTGDFDFVNMSFGGDYGSEDNVPQLYKDVIQAAKDSGAILVAAYGNNGEEDMYHYPAVDPNVQAIGALDGYLQKSWFSNYGKDLFLSTIGERVYSTVPMNKGKYDTKSGTSMSSPAIVGVLALMKQSHSWLSGQDLLDLAVNEADGSIGISDGWDKYTGHGVGKIYPNSVTPFEMDVRTNASPSKSTYSSSDTWVIYQNVNNAGANFVDVAYAKTKMSLYKKNASNGDWYFKGYVGEGETDINGNKTHFITNEWGTGDFKAYVYGEKGIGVDAEWIYFSVE